SPACDAKAAGYSCNRFERPAAARSQRVEPGFDRGGQRLCLRPPQSAGEEEVELESKGIPRRRLQHLAAACDISEELELLEDEPLEALRLECAIRELPFVVLRDRRELAICLLAIALWDALPHSELVREARHWGVPTSAVDTEGLIAHLVDALWTSLAEARGVPVRRLPVAVGIALVGKAARLEGCSAKRVEAEFGRMARRRHLPAEPGAGKQFYIELIVLMLVLEEASIEQLKQECREAGLAGSANVTGEAAQRELLQRRLLGAALSDRWEARGIPIARLGMEVAWHFMHVHPSASVHRKRMRETVAACLPTDGDDAGGRVTMCPKEFCDPAAAPGQRCTFRFLTFNLANRYLEEIDGADPDVVFVSFPESCMDIASLGEQLATCFPCRQLRAQSAAQESIQTKGTKVRALIEEVAARHSGDMQTVLIYDDSRFPSDARTIFGLLTDVTVAGVRVPNPKKSFLGQSVAEPGGLRFGFMGAHFPITQLATRFGFSVERLPVRSCGIRSTVQSWEAWEDHIDYVGDYEEGGDDDDGDDDNDSDDDDDGDDDAGESVGCGSKAFQKVLKVLHAADSVVPGSDEDLFLEPCLQRLCRIVAATGAKIVLSSSWRLEEEALAEVRRQLERVGLELYDTTRRDSSFGYASRAEEILDWLREAEAVETCVVLDDLDLRHAIDSSCCVVVDGKEGLRDVDVEAAVQALTGAGQVAALLAEGQPRDESSAWRLRWEAMESKSLGLQAQETAEEKEEAKGVQGEETLRWRLYKMEKAARQCTAWTELQADRLPSGALAGERHVKMTRPDWLCQATGVVDCRPLPCDC
ncbi:Kidins220, partial [Symbiodinium microadriaticum]